jgi:three-Cys-motif partner protein
VDKNSICISDLKERTQTNKEKIKFFSEDCNNVIDKIIEGIPDYSLSLIIIDPASLQFNFDSFEKLSKTKGDLIINYPIGPVERAISAALVKDDYKSSKLDKFHPGWREIVTKKSWGHSKKQNVRDLMKDYTKKVCDMGYFSAKLSVPFKNSKNATLYFLIYFSKDKKGIEFWEKEQKGFIKKKRQLTLV